MSDPVWNVHAPNLICIGANQSIHGDFSGRIWHQYQDMPLDFSGTMDLIRKIESLLDEWNFPQRSTNSRSFTGENNPVKVQRKGVGPHMNEQRIQRKQGDLGTFIVHVKYRQNATWQGEVMWTEARKRQSFRSVLELLKMMDGALESTIRDGSSGTDYREKDEMIEEGG